MPTYRVGDPFHLNRTTWPETAQFNHRMGGWELVLFFGSPKPQEIEAVRSANVRIGVAELERCLFLLYDFGRSFNGDAPYQWHLVPEAQRTTPDAIVPPMRIYLPIILVDAHTGRVRALRMVSLSPRVSFAVVDAIRKQPERPFDAADYDRRLQAVYARYTNADMMRVGLVDRAGMDPAPETDIRHAH